MDYCNGEVKMPLKQKNYHWLKLLKDAFPTFIVIGLKIIEKLF
jgi:hypothetical protein